MTNRCKSAMYGYSLDGDQCIMPAGHTGVHCGEAPYGEVYGYRIWAGGALYNKGFICWNQGGEELDIDSNPVFIQNKHQREIQKYKGEILPL